MSRNLGCSTCYHCGSVVRLEETPRPITQQEAGVYYDEYRTMLVANATCPDCEANYLAWCEPPTQGIHSEHMSKYRGQGPVLDLSYRSTFNDEPGEVDLPKYHVIPHIELERVPYSENIEPVGTLRKRWEEEFSGTAKWRQDGFSDK